jgi:MFS family permease
LPVIRPEPSPDTGKGPTKPTCGVVSVLVIADLTRGTGRFNLTLGAITTAVGIGAALSQVIAGSIVHHVGFRAGFFFLAGVASAALAILYFFMPETRNTRLAIE